MVIRASNVFDEPDDGAAVQSSSGDIYRYRRLATFMYPFGVAAHAAMVLVFYLLKQPELCLFNVLSVAMWVGGYFLDKHGRIRTAYLLAMTEVVLYGTLGTLYLGLETGLISVFIYPAATLYFVPFVSPKSRTRAIVLIAFLLAGAVALSAGVGALSPIEPRFAAAFLAANMLIMVIGIAIIMNAFSEAVQRAENRLAEANQKLSDFSLSVSEYLDPLLVDGLRNGDDLSPRTHFLTVFFADLAGSTRISRSMSEEAFGDMLQEFVREMQRIIKSHDGFLEDISGDGIFGYLGNFSTSGPKNDAVQVVTLAVEMQERLSFLNPEFKVRYGLPEPLSMRIGISSGNAQVGKTSGARAIYTANGDIVNLGAKLEQRMKDIPEAGGILLSKATAKLVEGDFILNRFEALIEEQAIEVFSLASRTPDRQL